MYAAISQNLEFWPIIFLFIKCLLKVYSENKKALQTLQKCFEFVVEPNESKDKKTTILFSTVIRKLDDHLKKDMVEQNVHQLFHDVKKFFLTVSTDNFSDNLESTYDFYKGCKGMKNTFEDFQSQLKVVQDTKDFYKFYN